MPCFLHGTVQHLHHRSKIRSKRIDSLCLVLSAGTAAGSAKLRRSGRSILPRCSEMLYKTGGGDMAVVEAQNDGMDELRRIIWSCPVVDNHAHNLLQLPQLKTHDFLSSTSEAEGEALQDHYIALPHRRAVRQLRQLYDLSPTADWDAVLRRRQEVLATDATGLIRRCLAGTHTILIDDGLDGLFEDYAWHDQFTTAPCKRIVRIEAVAADILSVLHKQNKLPIGVAIADNQACTLGWATFVTAFEQNILAAMDDAEVVGFKSVICYRTGLDVVPGPDVDVNAAGLSSFISEYLPSCIQKNFRVQSKSICDLLVLSTCNLISANFQSRGVAKPFQFHTGLGDNDISLLRSNPACMQPLVKAYANVPFVLLHSSYPYTREAGYLATVYKNVYLDIGEVFPQVSRDGQEQILRQAFELTPTSKILWSTDGHHFPETYWLANLQGREAYETVLCSYVAKEDLTVAEAVQAATDMLFENSNRLYGLGLKLPELLPVPTRMGNTDKIADNASNAFMTAPNFSPLGSLAPTGSPATKTNFKFVFVQWLDYMAQMRSRCLPIAHFEELLRSGGGCISISKGNLGTTQNDHMSSICDPVGTIWVEPDLASLRPMQDVGPVKHAATVMARYVDEQGVGLSFCPRVCLQNAVDLFASQHKVHFLVGFEIEITFCRRDAAEGTLTPLDTVHAWGTFSDEQYTTALPLLIIITTALQNIGVQVQQIHSEAGAGQYEFVLPPLPPVQAVDTLIQAKQCIQQIAATHNLRATCHPMPFPGIGTAAHAHISFNSQILAAEAIEMIEESFMASVLQNLPAVCAVTMPQEVSYSRVVDNGWTGGTWVAWGTNNRETPLRKVKNGRWEVRCLDGTANMYFVLATILHIGLYGVNEKLPLAMKDCVINTSKLDEQARNAVGIAKRLPGSLDEALEELERGEVLWDAVGREIVGNWIAVKKAEQVMLREMGEEERRVWLMERY